MNRKEALKLVEERIENKNLVKHCLAVEVCMAALADYFKESRERWALAGLLHDIDYEETKDSPERHSLVGAEMLEEIGADKEIVEAVKTHNEMHGIPPQGLMAKALFCLDPLTGLIVAATLVLPEKKIRNLNTENVLNRFKEKSFARGANREIIQKCSEIGLGLEQFIEIALEAMQKIDKELGL